MPVLLTFLQFHNVKFEMINELSEGDYEILQNVLSLANERYMKQSRIHRRSSFNILRVLSAFKDTCMSYPWRKEHIYNWIMYITKTSNPQSYQQWYNAISHIIHKQSHSANSGQNSNESKMNKSVNEYEHQSFQNNETSHNSKIYKQTSDFIANESFTKTRSQSYLNMSRVPVPVSSKMHYISFEPDLENKENMNMNSNTIKSDNSKFDLPTKTPVEQSFIHNLPVSTGSPFVLSKITNNTKELTELQQQEEHGEEWVSMKMRANIFHEINLRMKAFSALLANFQAFDEVQQINKKCSHFVKKCTLNKFIKSIKFLRQRDQHKQQLNQRSSLFYQKNTLRKSFKILYVFYQLKISKFDNNQFDVNKMNRINFQFLISLMLGQLKYENENQEIGDTPKSLRHKTKHFQNIQDCDRIQMISQHFSHALRMNKSQISNIFELYNKYRKQLAFRTLKNNIRYFPKQQYAVGMILKKQAIYRLQNYFTAKLTKSAKVKMMACARDKKTMQQSFKALLEYQLSQKLYEKRQQYLKNQHISMVRRTILHQWIHRLQQKKIENLGYIARIEEATQRLKTTIFIKYMKQIIKKLKLLKLQDDEMKQAQNMYIYEGVFNYLKARVAYRKIHSQISNKSNNRLKKQAITIWANLCKIKLATLKIRKYFQVQPFLAMKKQAEISKKQQQLDKCKRNRMSRKLYKSLKLSYNTNVKLEQEAIKKVQFIIRKHEISLFNIIVKHQLKVKQVASICQALKQKQEKTKFFIQLMRKKYLLNQIIQRRKDSSGYNNKISILNSVFGNRAILHDKSQHAHSVLQTLTRNHTILKREAVLEFKYWHVFRRKCAKIKQYYSIKTNQFVKSCVKKYQRMTSLKLTSRLIQNRKNRAVLSKCLKILIEVHKQEACKKSRAYAHYEKRIKFNTMLAIAKLVINTQEKTHQLQKNLAISRKACAQTKLLTLLKSQFIMTNKVKKLMKVLGIKQLCFDFNHHKNLKNKKELLSKRIKLRTIQHFQFSSLLQEQHNKYLEQKLISIKKLAVFKINSMVFRHILCRKQLYMAAKFKAMNLCRMGFQALLNNCGKAQLQQSKKYRIHEHISTSYSSI